jgi:hypothetical protein
MTEIAIHEDQPFEIPSPLAVWADSARRAATVAVSLAKTPFVPQSLRGRDDGTTAANITAAILTGQELGIEPMASLRSIDVIQGTPAMRAHALRGLVQSKGHKVWVEDANATRAIVCGLRRGDEQVQRSVWTMDRAKALGLATKDNWRKQPQAMLVARATAEVCRLIASDVILGIPYAVEELGDDEGGAEHSTAAPVKRTARRRQPVAVPDDPEPEVPMVDAPLPEPDWDEVEKQAAQPDPEPEL